MIFDVTLRQRDAIRRVLDAAPPLSTTAIAERLDDPTLSRESVRKHLYALERARKVERVPQTGPKGTVYWQVKTSATPEPLHPLDELGVLAELFDDAEEQEWQEGALCAQTDPEAFFPERGGSTREAKRICQACDVRAECLEYALAHDERFGIWGGLSERERRKLKKRAG